MSKKENKKSEGVEIPVIIRDKAEEIEPEEGINESALTSEEEPVSEGDKIAQLEEQIRRLSAEFENFRRRQEKRYDEAVKYAAEDVIKSFFPVLDNINHALLQMDKESSVESLKKAFEMIGGQMAETLSKLGVEEINSVGEPFNPEMHHALMVEKSDECKEETVIEEFQKGYVYRGRILRPAMVKVSCS